VSSEGQRKERERETKRALEVLLPRYPVSICTVSVVCVQRGTEKRERKRERERETKMALEVLLPRYPVSMCTVSLCVSSGGDRRRGKERERERMRERERLQHTVTHCNTL